MTKLLPEAYDEIQHESTDELINAVANSFVKLASESIDQKGSFCVALSGGNTPKALFSKLVSIHESNNNAIVWEKIHFFWGDERYVPKTDEQSNYKMTVDYLLSKVPVPDANIFAVPTEEANAMITADAYTQTLRTYFKLADEGEPQFDLALLGMGPDGHCASLFPHSPVVNAYVNAEAEKGTLVVANWVEKFTMFRITLTPPVINNASNIIFLVTGAEKKAALKEVLHGDYNPLEYPSQLIHPTRGHLQFHVSL